MFNNDTTTPNNAANNDLNFEDESLYDGKGTLFDPEQHCTDADGNPKKTKAGLWRKKPGASKNTTKSQPTEKQIREHAANLATALVDIGTGAMTSIAGPHWAASDDEKKRLIEAYQLWLAELGDTPPWLQCVIVTVAYAGPRLAVTAQLRAQKRQQTKKQKHSQPESAPVYPKPGRPENKIPDYGDLDISA